MSDDTNDAGSSSLRDSADEEMHEIKTKNCGSFKVYVQGDLDARNTKAVFLTVHDIGCNHYVFHDFVEHPAMAVVKQRSIFIHVDIPGQEDNACDLANDFQFPKMQTLAEDLISILDELQVKLVVCFGEGSGANILLRFAALHPDRVLGLLLVHVTASTAGVIEVVKDKIMSRRLSTVGMNASAEQFLVLHKFGSQFESAENKEKLIQDYTDKLKTKINPKNLRRYVEAYMNRSDLNNVIDKSNFKVDTLLVTGSKSSNTQSTIAMQDKMDKTKVSLIRIDGVGDVLTESPDQLAKSLLLFVQGIGQLTSVTLPGVERHRTHSGGESLLMGRRRTYSMEEYDIPRRRASLAAQHMNATLTIKEN